MKRKLIIALICLLVSCPVFAKTVHVQALEDFSTENPPHTLSVKLLDNLYLDEDTILFKNGVILEGKIVDVTDPKRLKRDAGFSFVPLKSTDENGVETEISGYYPAKYTAALNKGRIAKDAALGVGNYFVKGFSLGYSAIEGAVKNEKDNRFKSSINSVYEDTPFSYVEKGEEIVIKKDGSFLLNFKVKEPDNLPNYEYTPLE